MGYSTEFFGSVRIEPPLNSAEIAWLTKFSETRRMKMKQGPYFVDNTGHAGQDGGPHVIDHNEPPDGQPGLWCQWVPAADGSALEWNRAEKFYDPVEWMEYLIEHFLADDGLAKERGDPQFAGFTFNHRLNGRIMAAGEELPDVWRLDVEDNEVEVTHYGEDLDLPADLYEGDPAPGNAFYMLSHEPSTAMPVVEALVRMMPPGWQGDGLYEFMADLADVLPPEQGEPIRKLLRTSLDS